MGTPYVLQGPAFSAQFKKEISSSTYPYRQAPKCTRLPFFRLVIMLFTGGRAAGVCGRDNSPPSTAEYSCTSTSLSLPPLASYLLTFTFTRYINRTSANPNARCSVLSQ